jgi:hypothetical protein
MKTLFQTIMDLSMPKNRVHERERLIREGWCMLLYAFQPLPLFPCVA